MPHSCDHVGWRSPPFPSSLWVTYLCSRRQERYHFMSGGGRGFLPHPPSLGSAVREIESGKVACRRALIPGDEIGLILSYPIHNPFQTNPASRRFIPENGCGPISLPSSSSRAPPFLHRTTRSEKGSRQLPRRSGDAGLWRGGHVASVAGASWTLRFQRS